MGAGAAGLRDQTALPGTARSPGGHGQRESGRK